MFTLTLTLTNSHQHVLRLNIGLYRCLSSHYTFRLMGELVLSSQIGATLYREHGGVLSLLPGF